MAESQPRIEPFVKDALVTVSAPAFAVSPRDGQLRGDGVAGVYLADRRVLSRLVLTVDGSEPEPIHSELRGANESVFVAIHRLATDPVVGPTVMVERARRLSGDSTGRAEMPIAVATEQITIRNRGSHEHHLTLRLIPGVDLLDISEVRAGRTGDEFEPEGAGGERTWSAADGTAVRLDVIDEDTGKPLDGLSWPLHLAPGAVHEFSVRTELREPAGTRHVVRPKSGLPWKSWENPPDVVASDDRLARLVTNSLEELERLVLAHSSSAHDVFLGAGSPWYLTLFGRDSIWAARMALPLGTELARGTLNVLARLQGRRDDPATEEQPGRIVHELRRTGSTHSAGLEIPARYYGSVDATPLFVALLVDAWRWGMPEREVESLLPAAFAALSWVRATCDHDDDGFVRCRGHAPGGLANQGWKDSPDAVQSAAGKVAPAPLALAEVQGYTYEAVLGAAALMERFGGGDPEDLRIWAKGLRTRFHERFWVDDPDGRYIAIAVDAEGRPVSGPASNMGHLIGTGILDGDEIDAVAAWLTSPKLDTGFGLRTLGNRSAGFNPLGYHTGSVWAHDTAIAASGLAATGRHRAAAKLFDGLLDAATWFGHRLPELWGGEQREPNRPPLPYPSACRPQAWAAASAVALLRAIVGLYPDVPAGQVRLDPLRPTPWGECEVSGLRVAGTPVSAKVDADGHLSARDGWSGLQLMIYSRGGAE